MANLCEHNLRIRIFFCTFALAMKTSTVQRLYHIDRTALKILNYSVYSMFLLALLALVDTILRWCGLHLCEYAFYSTLTDLYRYAWIVCGSIAGGCVIVRIALSPFVKSEEEEAFEQKLDYVLQQRQQEDQPSQPYSPLRNLTPEQEAIVQKTLHELPSNVSKPHFIHLALVSRYLTALEQMNKADLTDRTALRAWVHEVTKKEVPPMSQFNEAIPSTNRKELAKIRQQWEKLLS